MNNMSKKPKKNSHIGDMSGQGITSAYISKGWRFKANQYVILVSDTGGIIRNYRIKALDLIPLIRKAEFKIMKPRVHRYLVPIKGE